MTQPKGLFVSAQTPQELNSKLIEDLNQGDIDAAVSCYEPEALFSAEPGKSVTGHAAIREVFEGFQAIKPKVTVESTELVAQAGDIAVTNTSWTVSGTGPDGNPVELAGNGTEIMRRQPDGTWSYALDFMYGVPE